MRSLYLVRIVLLTFIFLNCFASSSESNESDALDTATASWDIERDTGYSDGLYDNEKYKYLEDSESSASDSD
jgi:hypothetical protein